MWIVSDHIKCTSNFAVMVWLKIMIIDQLVYGMFTMLTNNNTLTMINEGLRANSSRKCIVQNLTIKFNRVNHDL